VNVAVITVLLVVMRMMIVMMMMILLERYSRWKFDHESTKSSVDDVRFTLTSLSKPNCQSQVGASNNSLLPTRNPEFACLNSPCFEDFEYVWFNITGLEAA